MSAGELKKAVQFASLALKGTLIFLGASTNIFSAIDNGINSVDRIAAERGYRNKTILRKYLETMVKYKVMVEKNGEYFLEGSFSVNIDSEDLKTSKTTEDFTTYSYALMKFFNHYLIDEKHPHVTTSFISDPDVWGLWLESKWFRLSREVIADEGNIRKGEAVLDVGCGSSSPSFYGSLVGAQGKVLGIDSSPGMVQAAQDKLKKKGYGWVAVKEFNIEQFGIFKDKYDVAVIADVLQYVKDITKVLKNIDTTLKKNGRMIIFTTCFADSDEEHVPVMEFMNAHVKDYVKSVTREELENNFRLLGYEMQDVSENSMMLIAQKV